MKTDCCCANYTLGAFWEIMVNSKQTGLRPVESLVWNPVKIINADVVIYRWENSLKRFFAPVLNFHENNDKNACITSMYTI